SARPAGRGWAPGRSPRIGSQNGWSLPRAEARRDPGGLRARGPPPAPWPGGGSRPAGCRAPGEPPCAPRRQAGPTPGPQRAGGRRAEWGSWRAGAAGGSGAVVRPRSNSRLSAWKTSQVANGSSAALNSWGAGQLLDPDMDRDPLDLRDRAGDFEDLTVRDVA